jgi:hypothetical protein
MTAFWDISRVVSLKWTDDSEVSTTSIIRAITEAVCTSETSVYFNKTTRDISQKTVIFKVVAVRT